MKSRFPGYLTFPLVRNLALRYKKSLPQNRQAKGKINFESLQAPSQLLKADRAIGRFHLQVSPCTITHLARITFTVRVLVVIAVEFRRY
jgi:hypothetical protein